MFCRIIEKIHKKLPTCKAASELSYVGQTGGQINPALELIKSVCRVLALDSSIEAQVMGLRRNLLRLVGIGEFSDSAVWTEPCISFILPEVICKACNHVRDIDLCKDNYRHTENEEACWLCPSCKNSYDNIEIENMLIDCLNRKAMAYLLQDLQCLKCKQVSLLNTRLLSVLRRFV